MIKVTSSKLLKKIRIYLLSLYYKKPKKEQVEYLIKRLQPKITEKRLIRIGGEKDGGYLVPDDLEGIEACFSPGVGGKSRFELECARLGMEIFMADASVDKPGVSHPKFNFQKKFLGKRQKKNFTTLQKWLNSSDVKADSDLLLQMDIEGYEYEVLNSTSIDNLKRFRIIIIEFHGLSLLGLPYFFQRSKKALEKLLVNHTCVHIHPNNCCGIKEVKGIKVPEVAEFTFLRNDRIQKTRKANAFPHFLDRDSTDHESISLPEVWYK